MTELRTFCNQLVAFFEDLSETYPEETNLSKVAQTTKLMKQANPRYVYNTFMTNVYNEYASHILDEDEEYILGRAKEGYAEFFSIFDKHWSTMTEANKQAIWRYIKTLVLLARAVPVKALAGR